MTVLVIIYMLQDGRTALLLAVRANHIQTARILAQSGASMSVCDQVTVMTVYLI